MKLILPTLLAPLVLSAFASASSSFGGSSLYFLQGLSSTDQNTYIDTLASYGAKVVRIWVNSLGTGCVKGSNVVTSIPDFETTLGTYNYANLNALDAVLAKLVAKGMKAIISPHDGNDIHGSGVSGNGCDIYCETYSTSFYSSTAAQAYYDARIKAILTYKSPSSGLEWGNWPEAILAFDIENEPFQFTSDGANDDPSGWLCGRAENFKKYITSSDIKVATGGIGGDQSHEYNMLPAALKCSSIDLMSIHAYVGSASTWPALVPGWVSTAEANGKTVYIEEWGVATSYASNFNSQVASLNAQKVPWVYWQFILGDDATETCNSGCCTSYDGFEIGLNSGKGDVSSALATALTETTNQDWSFAGFSGTGTSPPPPITTTTTTTTPSSTPFPKDTCTWGCEGWDCSSSSPCQSAYSCSGGYCGDCTWGCSGWDCSTSSPCNADYTCVSGYCHHSGPAT